MPYSPNPRLTAIAAFLLLTLAAGGCAPAGQTPSEALQAYFEAVQSRDLDALYCLMAGAAQAEELGTTDEERRAGFADWTDAYYGAYESGRDEGRVEIDPQGLTLVKLLSLGRGTFVTFDRPKKVGSEGVRLDSHVRPAYAHIDLSRLPAGTTFYLCGVPLGRVHALQIPHDSREVSADVLESVTLRWSLVSREPTAACGNGWAVAGVESVDETWQTTEVTWRF